MSSLTDKYRPKGIKEIANQKIGLSKIVEFLQGFEKSKKKALFVYGPTGTGKTCSIYAVANELNFDIVELNSDEFRDKEAIENILGAAMKTGSLFGKKKLILVDELESFSRSDYGGLAALTNLIKTTKFPVLVVALDLWDQKFSSIKYYCDTAEFKGIHTATIKKYLQMVLENEGVQYDEEVAEFLSKNSEGDLRAALNDLDILICGKKKVTKEDITFIETRSKEEKIFGTIQGIFKADSSASALDVFEKSNMDFETVSLWLNENITSEFQDPAEIAKAYDHVSHSDVFSGRIRRRQSWSLQKYVIDLAVAGMAASRTSRPFGFTRYNPPSKLMRLSRTKAMRNTVLAIALKIGQKTHTSSRVVRETYIPMLKTILKADKEHGQKIASQLNLEKEEVDFLLQ
jgi:replication factor C large subunit